MEYKKIRLVIVDDVRLIRECFKDIFEKLPDMSVVGMADNSRDAIEIVKSTRPDIVLIDIQMETEFAGINAIKKMKELYKNIKIIVLSSHEQEKYIFQAFSAGAMDYIIKTSQEEDIVKSVRNVYKNKISLKPDMSQRICDKLSTVDDDHLSLIYTLNILAQLSTVEFEILNEIHKGKSWKEIAEERFVNEEVIMTQVKRILDKFNARTSHEVTRQLENFHLFELYHF